jgi:RHS repeat-associated protein
VYNWYNYDPWGNTFDTETYDPIDNPFMFTGQWFDEEIHQYYLRARMYDPQLARFSTRDPYEGAFENPMELHRYLYCQNDPIGRVDISGKWSLGEIATVTGNIMTMYSALINARNWGHAMSQGDYKGAAMSLGWLVLDVAFMGMGSGSGLVEAGAGVLKNVGIFSSLGMKASAIYGYVSTSAHLLTAMANADISGGGWGNGGGWNPEDVPSIFDDLEPSGYSYGKDAKNLVDRNVINTAEDFHEAIKIKPWLIKKFGPGKYKHLWGVDKFGREIHYFTKNGKIIMAKIKKI